MRTTIKHDPTGVHLWVRTVRLMGFGPFDVKFLQPLCQLVHSPFKILRDWIVFVLVIPLVGEQLANLHHRRAPLEVADVHVLKEGSKSEDGLAFLGSDPCDIQEFHRQGSLFHCGLSTQGVRGAV